MKNIDDNSQSRDQRREAERMLAQEVKQLMTRTETEGLTWTGSRRDLMEALHVAFTTGIITDSEGMGLSFTTIVSHTCQVLHTPVPSNPYGCAQRGSRRKGVFRRSYIERYQWQLFGQGTTMPLSEHISK